MTEIETIADQLEQCVGGDVWYGASLRELLADVTAERAAARPVPQAHSIEEIFAHISAWLPAVRRRLNGEAVELSSPEEWPQPTELTEASWARAQTSFDREHDQLLKAIRSLSPEALDATTPGRPYSVRYMLCGVTQHVVYHSAQIALLKKAGPDPKRQMLRHTVATVAYRGGKALRGAPAGFGSFRAGPTTRTPEQILAHIGDLFDWGLSIAKGKAEFRESEPLPWDKEVERFFSALGLFDAHLASGAPLRASAEEIFQGPVADALNHVGQLALIRRLAQSPVRGESYFRADIVVGRVGPEQAAARREFD